VNQGISQQEKGENGELREVSIQQILMVDAHGLQGLHRDERRDNG
jgi:hypothetical protein